MHVSALKTYRLPAVLLLAGIGLGLAYPRWQPALYQSTAVLQIEPTDIGAGLVDAEHVVRPMQMRERSSRLAQEVLFRTRLERLMSDLNLYVNERKRMPIDDLLELVRSRITIAAVGGSAAESDARMVVSYVGSDPEQVLKVTERLTAIIMEASLATAADQARRTTKFLEAQVEETEDALALALQQRQDARSRTLQLKVETLESAYKSLLSRLTEAQMVVSIEERMLGDRLVIAEPARLPQRPIGPAPWQSTLLGGAAGIAAALVALGLNVFRRAEL